MAKPLLSAFGDVTWQEKFREMQDKVRIYKQKWQELVWMSRATWSGAKKGEFCARKEIVQMAPNLVAHPPFHLPYPTTSWNLDLFWMHTLAVETTCLKRLSWRLPCWHHLNIFLFQLVSIYLVFHTCNSLLLKGDQVQLRTECQL